MHKAIILINFILFMLLPSASFSEPNKNFAGWDWGLGVSLTVDTGSRDRVEEASIIDGTIRVNKDNNAIPRIMLELHHFIWTWSDDTVGLGLFSGIQPGGDDIIDAFGGGIMMGFRKNKTDFLSFNIGVGVMVDPNTKVLGDGFVANQAPPGTETEVRFKETEQIGILVLVSTSF